MWSLWSLPLEGGVSHVHDRESSMRVSLCCHLVKIAREVFTQTIWVAHWIWYPSPALAHMPMSSFPGLTMSKWRWYRTKTIRLNATTSTSCEIRLFQYYVESKISKNTLILYDAYIYTYTRIYNYSVYIYIWYMLIWYSIWQIVGTWFWYSARAHEILQMTELHDIDTSHVSHVMPQQEILP